LNGLNNTLLFNIHSINPDNNIPPADVNLTVYELNDPRAKSLFSKTFGHNQDPNGAYVIIAGEIHAYRTTKSSPAGSFIAPDGLPSQSMLTSIYSFINNDKGYVIYYTASPVESIGLYQDTVQKILNSLHIE
jgi:hypothetical protein